MNQDHSSVPFAPGRFYATDWSLVLAAAQSEAPGAVEALAELSAQYWRPLYAFARRLKICISNRRDGFKPITMLPRLLDQ